jgi:hypothetical protein
MKTKSLVIAIAGLRASALGAYGNSVIQTSALDAVASRARVFDWCHAQAHSASEWFHAVWSGDNKPGLVVTDDSLLATTASGMGSDVALLDCQVFESARLFSETHFAKLANLATQKLDDWDRSADVVIYTQGLCGAWDAPHEVVLALAEDDGLSVLPSISPPQLMVDPDSDEVFLSQCRYHAQVLAIDAVVEGIVGFARELTQPFDRIAICGTRGFSLGEHGIVGTDLRDYSESTHVPLIVIEPGCELTREARLCWLVSALRQSDRPSSPGFLRWRSRDGAEYVRTRDWLLRDCDEKSELFVKPDDRWDANDIASLCPQQVEDLRLLAKV